MYSFKLDNAGDEDIVMRYKTIKIHPELYQKLEEFIRATGAFESVNEYVNFMLETMFLPEEQILSTKEHEILSERLKALGYLD